MKRIEILPAWSFRDEQGNQLDPQLFKLLRAIHARGKLTDAAKDAGISYRHAWNLLNHWANFFAFPLVNLQKGRGATLSPLGEKLLWAEQRVVARLEPQLKNLASELNLEIDRTLEGVRPMIRLHASHGPAVALLPDFAEDLQLDLQYKTAEEALASLSRGACDVAGFHVPTKNISDSLIETYSRHLKPRVHKVICFVSRRQGLMLKSGNPVEIHALSDLTRKGVRFINRQKDSGTRALLDSLLRHEKIPAKKISGYSDEEFTHSAVAAFVAADMADAGFGVEAAARQFGLDFVPLAEEHYVLVCHHRTLEQEAMIRLMTAIRSEAFLQAVARLPGYRPTDCGQVMGVEDIFPWYRRS